MCWNNIASKDTSPAQTNVCYPMHHDVSTGIRKIGHDPQKVYRLCE